MTHVRWSPSWRSAVDMPLPTSTRLRRGFSIVEMVVVFAIVTIRCRCSRARSLRAEELDPVATGTTVAAARGAHDDREMKNHPFEQVSAPTTT
jgi:hypothetical protein